MKILFRAYNFFLFVHTFQWTSSEFFFYFRFSNRKSQTQQKLARKSNHFTIQLRSRNLTHFENLSSLTLRTICSRNTDKTLSDFKIFSRKHVYVWCHKWCSANAIFDTKQKHFFWKHMSMYFVDVDVVRFYLVGGGGWGSVDGRLNNFIEATHCLGLVMFYNVSF